MPVSGYEIVRSCNSSIPSKQQNGLPYIKKHFCCYVDRSWGCCFYLRGAGVYADSSKIGMNACDGVYSPDILSCLLFSPVELSPLTVLK